MSVRGFVVSLIAAAAAVLLVPAGASAAQELEVPNSTLNKFGNVYLGDTGSKTVTVKSVGTDPVEIASIEIYQWVQSTPEGPINQGEFFSVEDDGCSGETLATDETCQIELTFAPTAVGFRYTSVFVNATDPAVSDAFGIDGTGINPGIAVSAGSHDFGSVEVGHDAPLKVLTVTNDGTTDLTTNVGMTGEDNGSFYFDSQPNCDTIQPGQSCTITVGFRPLGNAGTKNGLLVIGNNTKDEGATWIPLSGTALKPLLSLSPTAAAFGDIEPYTNPSLTRTITLGNDGTGQLDAQFELTDQSPAEAFQLDQSHCDEVGPLPPFSTCQVSVTFKSNIAIPGTTYTAALIITSDGGSATVPVSATLVKGEASLSETSFTFDDTEVGQNRTGSLTLTSTGTAPLTFDTPEIGGADPDQFVVSLPASCLHLTNGQTCQVLVAFKPTKAAYSNAEVTLSGNFGTLDFGLSGRGNLAFLNLPGDMTFQQIPVGSKTTQELMMLSNGDAGFDLGALSFEGADAASFSAEPPAGGCSDLVRGEECNITVTYSPTTVGSHVAELRIAGNLEGGAQTVPVFGSARALTPAKVTLKLTGPKKVKRGKVLTLAAKLTNTGETPATGVVLKMVVPKKLAKTVKPVKVGTIAPGSSVTRKIKVKVKKTAKKGKKLKVTVTVSGTNFRAGKTGKTTTVR